MIICGSAASQSVDELLRSHLPTADLRVCKMSIGKERAIARMIQQCALAGQWLVVDGASDVVQWLLADLPMLLHDLQSLPEAEPTEREPSEETDLPTEAPARIHPEFQLFLVVSETLHLEQHERARLVSGMTFQLPLPSTTAEVVSMIPCLPNDAQASHSPRLSVRPLVTHVRSCKLTWRGRRRRCGRSPPREPSARTVLRSPQHWCCMRAYPADRALSASRFAALQPT